MGIYAAKPHGKFWLLLLCFIPLGVGSGHNWEYNAFLSVMKLAKTLLHNLNNHNLTAKACLPQINVNTFHAALERNTQMKWRQGSCF